MANNDKCNDEYFCRDFFVGFIFRLKLSFQISEFRVHWYGPFTQQSVIIPAQLVRKSKVNKHQPFELVNKDSVGNRCR